MDKIGAYVLTLCIWGLISGLFCQLIGQKTMKSAPVQAAFALITALLIVSPLVDVDAEGLLAVKEDYILSGQLAAEEGEEIASTYYRQVITERTQTYILEKAKSLKAEISVTVVCSDQAPYPPESVSLEGECSPYAKRLLSQWITDNLAIPQEAQQWIG